MARTLQDLEVNAASVNDSQCEDVKTLVTRAKFEKWKTKMFLHQQKHDPEYALNAIHRYKHRTSVESPASPEKNTEIPMKRHPNGFLETNISNTPSFNQESNDIAKLNQIQSNIQMDTSCSSITDKNLETAKKSQIQNQNMKKDRFNPLHFYFLFLR